MTVAGLNSRGEVGPSDPAGRLTAVTVAGGIKRVAVRAPTSAAFSLYLSVFLSLPNSYIDSRSLPPPSCGPFSLPSPDFFFSSLIVFFGKYYNKKPPVAIKLVSGCISTSHLFKWENNKKTIVGIVFYVAPY